MIQSLICVGALAFLMLVAYRVITLLAVTGLTHRQSYKDIFAVTCIKTTAVFVVIGIYYLTHWV